jgi:hypothetical protein
MFGGGTRREPFLFYEGRRGKRYHGASCGMRTRSPNVPPAGIDYALKGITNVIDESVLVAFPEFCGGKGMKQTARYGLRK